MSVDSTKVVRLKNSSSLFNSNARNILNWTQIQRHYSSSRTIPIGHQRQDKRYNKWLKEGWTTQFGNFEFNFISVSFIQTSIVSCSISFRQCLIESQSGAAPTTLWFCRFEFINLSIHFIIIIFIHWLYWLCRKQFFILILFAFVLKLVHFRNLIGCDVWWFVREIFWELVVYWYPIEVREENWN